ncbi:MAG: AMP-binding protein [Emcibacteraceae bacterium]|nr:AMP-binding protein [Emcibacteraceae bacterium]
MHQILCTNTSEQTAIITETGKVVTYSTLSDDIKRTASSLNDRELIFILCRNDYMSLLFYLAALDAGAVPLLLTAEGQGPHLKKLLELYSPQWVVGTPGTVNTQGSFDPVSQHEGYTLYRNNASTSPQLHVNLAFLATTSGSTGDPKLVRLSANNLKTNAAAIVEYLDITPDDRAITSLPISYSYGLSVVNSHLLAGASIVLSGHSLMEKEFWQEINTHNVTSFAGIPYHYEMLLRLGLPRLKIPSITKMTQAGGRLDDVKIEKIHKFCDENGIKFWVMYGQTEASPRMSYLPREDTVRKLGSIGIPISGGKLWIKGESEDDITSTGQIGELIYEGDNVCLGYARNKEDLAQGDANQNKLSTGDLARCDKEGYFYIEGRLTGFLKVFGNRISLNQIEKYLSEKGFVSAAYGQDDHLVVSVVVDKELDEEKIKRELAHFTGVNMTAISVVGIKELPRLATGKIDYQCLAKTQ